MSGCANWLFISQGRGNELFRYRLFRGRSPDLVGESSVCNGAFLELLRGFRFRRISSSFPCISGMAAARARFVSRFLSRVVARHCCLLYQLRRGLAVAASAAFDNPITTLVASFALLAVIQLLFLILTASGRNTSARCSAGDGNPTATRHDERLGVGRNSILYAPRSAGNHGIYAAVAAIPQGRGFTGCQSLSDSLPARCIDGLKIKVPGARKPAAGVLR